MTNVAPLLEQRLSPDRLRLLRLLADSALRHGVQLFLVGGTVRDLLLEQRPVDLDLSSVGASPKFADSLAADLGGEVLLRSQFGTSKLRVGAVTIDLAMSRKETYKTPGALPTVSGGSIEDDLKRRDFTVNAMAISLAESTWGALEDQSNGRIDLEARLVRVLHEKSFVDDATRIVRAVRYATRLGFRIAPDTEGLLKRDLGYLDTIKGDRVRHELERIFDEARADLALRRAQDMGVLSAIFPHLGLNDASARNLAGVDTSSKRISALLYVSLLTHPLPEGQTAGVIARLNMDSRWSRVATDTASVKGLFPKLREAARRPSQLHSLLSRFELEAIRGCQMATDDPLIAERLKRYVDDWRLVKTAMSGDDVIALGVPEGPMVGELLNDLLAARLDSLVATAEEERTFVTRRLAEK